MGPAVDLWSRYGVLGLAGRAWSRTFGRLLDVGLVLEWELETSACRVAPVPGYDYARAATVDSTEARDAAAILRVSLEGREGQDLFVARSGGRVVGCTWNDPVRGGRASQRGVAVLAPHRRKGLAASLLLFQAVCLAGTGVTAVDYRTPWGNRASRRLFEKLGARRIRAYVVLSLLGTRGRAFEVPRWLDRRPPGRRPR